MRPFFPQERPESCVPACLRMVLASAGLNLSEASLYDDCETDPDGTLPSKAAQCAKALGFDAASVRLSSIEELIDYMDSDCPHPIVFVNLSAILGISVTHAVVIESIDLNTKTVIVMDPAFPPSGQRQWKLALFEIGWKMARHQTILVTTA